MLQGDATALEQESGRFTGAVCFMMLHHVPTVELQDRVLAEIRRVLRPGGVLVASDALASPDLADNHEGDTYNPIDPGTLPARLVAAGFEWVTVTTNPYAWQAVAYAGA